MSRSPDGAEVAAKAVLADLNDRSGFDHWWGDIDSDIRREIGSDLAKAIEKAAHIGATRAVLADRERELLELKGPCSSAGCRLHYAHSGPCDIKEQHGRLRHRLPGVGEARMTGWNEYGHARMTGLPIDRYLGSGDLQDAENCGYSPASVLAELDIDPAYGTPEFQFREGRIWLTDGTLLERGGTLNCVWAVTRLPQYTEDDVEALAALISQAREAGITYGSMTLARWILDRWRAVPDAA